MSGGELVFTVARAAEIIGACTSSGIAILGIEVFPGLNVSTYDLHLKNPADEKQWPGYVRTNNALAADFLRRNPAPSTDEMHPDDRLVAGVLRDRAASESDEETEVRVASDYWSRKRSFIRRWRRGL